MNVYGTMGVLTEVDGRVQCHLCGEWYVLLGSHVYNAHEMTADEYREAFGINRRQGLVPKNEADRRRKAALENGKFIEQMGVSERLTRGQYTDHRTQARIAQTGLTRSPETKRRISQRSKERFARMDDRGALSFRLAAAYKEIDSLKAKLDMARGMAHS